MASGTYYITSTDANDGYWRSDNFFSAIGGNYIQFGDNTNDFHFFCLFSNVTIPQGSIIGSAYLRVYSNFPVGQSDTPKMKLHCENVDTGVPPTNFAEAEALSLTTGTDWDMTSDAWANGNWYDLGDFSSEVQEITDRGGWASGNNLLVVGKDDGSAAGQQRYFADYYIGPEFAAELHVEWSTALVMANADHLQVVDNVVLTQKHVLAAQVANHLHTVDNIVIVRNPLTIDGSDQLQVVDNIALTQKHTLAIQGGDQLQTVDSPAIQGLITVQSADQLQIAESPNVNIQVNAQSADQLQVVDSPSVNLVLTVQSCDQLQTVDNVKIGWSCRVEETLGIWDTIGTAWGKTIEDTLAFTEVVDKILAIIANDPLTLEEALTVNWTGTEEVESTLQMIGYLICGEIFNETSVDTLAFADVSSYLHQMISAIADTLGLTEVLTTQATFNPAIIEAIALTGLVEVLAHLHNTNEETLTLTDEPGVGWGKSIADTLAFTDVATPTFFVMAAIADSLVFTELVLHQFKINESILDTIEFATTLALQQILTSTVEDTLDFGITVKFDDEFWECWVLNTNQFNVSVYSGYDFNSYAVYNDIATGCKPDGIYKLSGTQDAGNDFVAGIILPETYFGTNRKKRFRKAYFGLSGGSPSIRMETDSGSKTYTITDSKANFSRDLYGRQWTLKVQDFDDLDFIELVPIILAR